MADLSAIEVFEDTGIYAVLLIFQKKIEGVQNIPQATIARCQDWVGRALSDVVEGRQVETPVYSVYNVKQTVFSQETWVVLPQVQEAVRTKMAALPTADEFLHIHQGSITGADDVFIIPVDQIPSREKGLFVPFLRDRDMELYTLPARTDLFMLYPYLGERKLDEAALRQKFPQTWEYLLARQDELEARPPVVKGQLAWWQPERPRQPDQLLRPKIITPHLVVVPRFSLDKQGKYAISRAPLLYPRDHGAEADLLRFFLAVLNSTPCYWHIARHSHLYQSGYVMLEVKTLAKTPVPNPTTVPPEQMRRLLNLVDQRLIANGPEAIHLEREIDRLVANLYQLSAEEQRALGIED